MKFISGNDATVIGSPVAVADEDVVKVRGRAVALLQVQLRPIPAAGASHARLLPTSLHPVNPHMRHTHVCSPSPPHPLSLSLHVFLSRFRTPGPPCRFPQDLLRRLTLEQRRARAPFIFNLDRRAVRRGLAAPAGAAQGSSVGHQRPVRLGDVLVPLAAGAPLVVSAPPGRCSGVWHMAWRGVALCGVAWRGVACIARIVRLCRESVVERVHDACVPRMPACLKGWLCAWVELVGTGTRV